MMFNLRIIITITLSWIALLNSVSLTAQPLAICDSSPMKLPPAAQQIFSIPMIDAQKLSSSEKADLGLTVLLRADQSVPLQRAYADYYVAQMYIDYPHQASRRYELLQSALSANVLSGAELQDTLFTLSLLAAKLGFESKANEYQERWQRISCEIKTQEAESIDPETAKPTLATQPSVPVVPTPVTPVSNVPTPAVPQSKQLQPVTASTKVKLLEYVEPLYPEQAFAKDIEGYVILNFTITREGHVADIVVKESSPAELFDLAAKQAVQLWRYRPQMHNGVAVDKPNHQIKLEFGISQGQVNP